MGFPLPSARRWILVENPPRLRPRASLCCGSSSGGLALSWRIPLFEHLLSHLQRAGALLPRFHPHGADPNPALHKRPPVSGARREHGPTHPPRSSGTSGWRCSARDQTPAADRARALPYGRSTGWLGPRGAMVLGGAARFRCLWRQKRTYLLPLLVGQYLSCHTPSLVVFENRP
jgi:hypothetical protein